ncbi:EamA family transporter [Lottiidibacillus patelloidae]|uniref:EamA family transporter n=1 Tax=Lottiidibacillus patelloidae TaxID=2670334 RepID=A0A263BYA7_9BACI|nr:DMT family transporter [Lottiidibacillus patelloidae]OZM58723.1 EamA family transporter [Lottiidibacillus patelloidae]
MNQPKINPYFMLAIGVIAVSSSAILVKLSSAPAPVIAFYRLFFSVVIMLPLFLIKYRHELKLITKRDWLFSAVSGVFLAFHFILWFESLNYTSVASSTVLVTLQPIFAFVGTYLFFKEKLKLQAILSGALGISGSIIVSWGDFAISGMALYGDFLALLACAMVTAYLLFGQTVRKRLSLITYTFVVYGICTFTLFLYVVTLQYELYPYPQSDWLYFVLLAIVPTLLGHTLFNWSLKWLSTSTISMSILFEPIGASILAYYILGEMVLWTQVIGGGVIIIGILMFLMSERKARRSFQKASITE